MLHSYPELRKNTKPDKFLNNNNNDRKFIKNSINAEGFSVFYENTLHTPPFYSIRNPKQSIQQQHYISAISLSQPPSQLPVHSLTNPLTAIMTTATTTNSNGKNNCNKSGTEIYGSSVVVNINQQQQQQQQISNKNNNTVNNNKNEENRLNQRILGSCNTRTNTAFGVANQPQGITGITNLNINNKNSNKIFNTNNSNNKNKIMSNTGVNIESTVIDDTSYKRNPININVNNNTSGGSYRKEQQHQKQQQQQQQQLQYNNENTINSGRKRISRQNSSASDTKSHIRRHRQHDSERMQKQQKGCEKYYSSQSTMQSGKPNSGNASGGISGSSTGVGGVSTNSGNTGGIPTNSNTKNSATSGGNTMNPNNIVNGRSTKRLPSLSSADSTSSSSSSCSGSCSEDGDTSSTSSGEPNLPYPGFPAVALKYLTQDTRPRNWCLTLITNPWFERISILVILLNCITLGMYQPCVDDRCESNRCKILQMFDDIIFAFFALEMSIKMVAMGIYGKNTYLADSWNRLDCFIVFAGLLEYVMHVENLNLTAIRTIRVLRPLRAINRIPSMRILVMLLLDTLPMLGNVLLLCFFVFFIFGIVGVQLWEGILRQRCVLDLPSNVIAPKPLPDEYRVRVRVNSVSFYYEFSKEQDYICSKPEDSGMHLCTDLPPYREGRMVCNATALPLPSLNYKTNVSCVNWNQYYTNCTQLGGNPFQGTISFDNIGLAWVAIFLVISLEGWTDIMYYVQDAHSFWDWIYFVLLIVIGSFFMINLCLVVIATQFSETKKREMERMRQERARYTSSSTLASSTNNSEPATCYAEIVKYIAHLWRRLKRRLIKKYRLYKVMRQYSSQPNKFRNYKYRALRYQRQQTREGLLPNADNLTFSPSRIKCHHPKCPKYNRKPSNIQDQMITVMVPLNSNNNNLQGASTQNLNLIPNNNSIIQHINNNNHTINGNNGTTGITGNIIGSAGHISSIGGSNIAIGMNNSHNSSPDNSEYSIEVTGGRTSNLKKNTNHTKDDISSNQKTILLKIPSGSDTEKFINPCTSGFLSPPTSARRRSSVMFNEYVILHTPPTIPEPTPDKNVCSSEKMTQAGDGSIWQVNLPQTLGTNLSNSFADCSELSLHDAMTCQELLAFSVAFSAALPTGQGTLESFYTSLTQHATGQQHNINLENQNTNNLIEDYSCCYDLYQNALSPQEEHRKKKRKRLTSACVAIYRFISKIFNFIRRYIKLLVEHKYFQQGILLAILINTLSMGIEYHDQPEELTAIVETSNIVFSAIFAVEMLLKVLAEGPFRYIANGFNVFDGVIVILSVIEIGQNFNNVGGVKGSSGLSVLRTFRLLRILKLVRFMPNLRRQLFVMLRTMDNVAVFFSLLVLFIFIFSILGMNLFGCKFCEKANDKSTCDRKNFDSLLWAIVTVFQILTQEDWNVVLFNGMEKTSHWAALYFVALMTFGNYVLFNLLVAILVEGFSSERNERREREQRELVKKLREENLAAENLSDGIFDESERSPSESSSTNGSYSEIRNKWHSAEDLRKANENMDYTSEPKCNIQKQRLLQPSLDYQLNDTSAIRKVSDKDISKIIDDDIKSLKKTSSIKERRPEASKLANLRALRDPPIIMTTAATPQDSPSTTLESGASFKNWSQQELQAMDDNGSENIGKSISSPSLLKPPALLGGQKVMEVERLPSIEFIPPSPQLERKPLNIQSNSQQINIGSNTSISNLEPSNSKTSLSVPLQSGSNINDTLPHISDSSDRNISNGINNNIGSCNGTNGNFTTDDKKNLVDANNEKEQIVEAQVQRSSSFKRFRRSSSKKKKKNAGSETEEDNIVLNNGRDNSQLNSLAARNDSFLKSANRIQNDTKDTNKLSPQNSIRRLSTSSTCSRYRSGHSRAGSISAVTSRRSSSCVYNNSQFYQNLNRHNSIKNYSTRRMSSIELALGKSSNLNIYSMENRKSMAFSNSKIDLEKWEKSLSSLNEIESNADQKNQHHHRRHHKHHHHHHHRRKSTKPENDDDVTLPEKISITQHISQASEHVSKIKILIERLKPKHFTEERDTYSLYIFPETNRFRQGCSWFVNQKWFDNVVLLFIALNCITLAMERPNIPPTSTERLFLSTANYVFTVVFTTEMFIKVVATGMFYGPDAYFTSGWNIMDGSLVTISIIDLLMSLISESSPRIFGILRVFRLLRSLRPLRVINRAPGLKLVVQTLLSSLRPIGNIVLICCTFFIIFGILGVQLFKGTFYYCEGEHIKDVRNKSDCLSHAGNAWINRKYNFDDLGKALMSLFVLSSRDGWVNIMYTGLDAVGVDQQPIVNYNEWRLLYFIAFILLVGFFVLNMFVGVVVENFHRCREEQEKEEKIRRAAKRALQMEKKRRRMHEPPYYTNYSPTRMFVHNVVTSKYFDLAIAAVIGLNVVTMAMEYYMMPVALEYALKIFNYFFTAVFILEAIMKLVALGWRLYLKDKWNQLDVGIVILSIVGIVLEELETNIIPINPTIIRVMRVLRIARVLKLLKMAKGIRALLDTVMQALPQVGNLGLLFFLLFFIFAALGVELFGRLECSDQIPCQGLGEHAHFANFGMAFLTLFRVATGDNWNGIMKDTLRDDCDDSADCVKNCCVSSIIAPIFFVIFVLMAQFVLVNVVVAVLMKHLEESHKQMEDELDMETELERELVREQEFEEEQALCLQLQNQKKNTQKRPLEKVSSLPANFTYSTPSLDKKFTNTQRRQTIQYLNPVLNDLLANANAYNTSSTQHVKSPMLATKPSQSQSQTLVKPASEQLAAIIGDPKTKKVVSEEVAAEVVAAATAACSNGSELLLNRARRLSKQYQELNVPSLSSASSLTSGVPRIQPSSLSSISKTRRSSIIRAKMLSREQSLDEHGIRRRKLEKKRMSCDNLPWGFERRGTIFESTESETGPPLESDKQSVKSDVCTAKRMMLLSPHFKTKSVDERCLSLNVPNLESEISATVTTIGVSTPSSTLATITPTSAQIPMTTQPVNELSPINIKPERKPFGRSLSIDQAPLGLQPARFLSVPTSSRNMPPRSRSGSTKQLFKQQALDEDQDIDESSLLLPTSSTVSSSKPLIIDSKISAGSTEKYQEGMSKSDSAEILRIISERRRMDQRDNSGNEDSDYNELLLVKSPYSSTET
ncbi:uncharacterized protein LOC129617143 isoform X3 [Condylostylus longicornis]|uniref:uncharacterized protein LOC129617143 isoform X3 n=1 Tax=Condylostylus longicornis TaxID=2530218 RepID=UPI00244DBD02|nr:uncharacterized protein LOC129617143 isoform X3 [Condylostylus longicornis]